LTWEAPSNTGGSPINHYRIFVTEKDNSGSVARIDTIGDHTYYKLKTQRAMWGRDFILTVQAINNIHKMSLISEPSIFSVADPLQSNKVTSLPAPIIQL